VRVAILHNHLKPGRITRVIENTVRALNLAGIESLVFCSKQANILAYPFANVRLIPELASKKSLSQPRAEDLKKALETRCKNEWGSLPDLWHVHNHSLGENLVIPAVVSQWAGEKQKLLLHLHDFAEDGRPANYKSLREELASRNIENLNQTLYPMGEHIGYAFCNERHRNYFKAAGIEDRHNNLLINPVNYPEDRTVGMDSPILKDKKLYLCPTQCGRRTNIGEFILWSAAASKEEVFGSTMAPAEASTLSIYNEWEAIAKNLGIPTQFGLGEQHSLHALINKAYAVVTTNMGDGFANTYLEPYLADAQLVGRDLPDITSTFTDQGIRFEGLYPRLDVPISWIGENYLRKTVHQALVRHYQNYRQVFQKPMTDEAMDNITQEDLVDFGRLNQSMQKTVIEMVNQNKSLKLDFAPEKLDRLLSPKQMEDNRVSIQRSFNTKTYGKTLIAIYQNILNAPAAAPDFLDTTEVLKSFLNPRYFNLLRT